METIGTCILNVPLSATKVLESVVSEISKNATPLLERIKVLYQQYIANTLGDTVCAFLSSAALSSWSFTAVKASIGLLSIIITLKVVETLTGNFITEVYNSIARNTTLRNVIPVGALVIGSIAMGAMMPKTQN